MNIYQRFFTLCCILLTYGAIYGFTILGAPYYHETQCYINDTIVLSENDNKYQGFINISYSIINSEGTLYFNTNIPIVFGNYDYVINILDKNYPIGSSIKCYFNAWNFNDIKLYDKYSFIIIGLPSSSFGIFILYIVIEIYLFIKKNRKYVQQSRNTLNNNHDVVIEGDP